MQIFLFLLFLLITLTACDSKIELEPGIKVVSDPHQEQLEQTLSFQFKNDYRIVSKYAYDIEAKILGIENYYFDQTSNISPIDLALGWGVMSDQRNVNQIEIDQFSRWYFWSHDLKSLNQNQIQTQSANVHIIPANEYIKNKLDDLEVGMIIRIQGLLANVSGPGNFYWPSSTSRLDTGDGSCEILYAKQIQVLEE